MSRLLLLALCSAATAQAVRLIVDDVILDAPRGWWTRTAPAPVVKMLGCPWCVSGWLSLAATIAATLVVDIGFVGAILWWGATWKFGTTIYFCGEVLAKYAQPDDDWVEVPDEDA